MFLGWLGIDRFYLGYIITGLLKLAYHVLGVPLYEIAVVSALAEPDSLLVILWITLAACAWYVIDIIRISARWIRPNNDSWQRPLHTTPNHLDTTTLGSNPHELQHQTTTRTRRQRPKESAANSVKPWPFPAPEHASKDKPHITAMLLSVFLGWSDIDRFYLGYITAGIAKAGNQVILWVLLIIDLDISPSSQIWPIRPFSEWGMLLTFIWLALSGGVVWWVLDIIHIKARRLQPKNGSYLSGPPWDYW